MAVNNILTYKYMGLSQSNIYSRLYICTSIPLIPKNMYERYNTIFVPHIESNNIIQDEEVTLSIIKTVKLETIIEEESEDLDQ